MAQLHLLLVIDSDDGTVHVESMDTAPVDSDQPVFDPETDEWRSETREETDLIIEIEGKVLDALRAAGLTEAQPAPEAEPNIAANDRLVRVLAAIDRAAIVSKRAAGTVAADLLALANPTVEAVAGVLYYTGSKGGKAAALSVAPSILAALTEAEA